MITTLDFFNYYFSFLLVFYIFYFTGKVINSFLPLNSLKAVSLSTNLFSGILSITIFTALTITTGKTILILTVPFFIYLIYKNKLKFNEFKFSLKQDLLITFFAASIIYLFQSYFYFDYINGTVKKLFVDNYTYGSTSEAMGNFKVENFDFGANYFIENVKETYTPYRYGDMWMNVISSFINQKSAVFNYYCVTLSILISCQFLFFIELINKNIWLKFSISFLLLFTSILFDPLLNNVHSLNYVSEPSLMGSFQQKLSFNVLFFLFSIYLFNKNKNTSIVLWLISPIFYVSYIPGIYGGVILFCILSVVLNIKSLKENLKYIYLLLIVFSILIIFFKFYNLYGREFSELNNPKITEIPLINKLARIYNQWGNNFKINVSNLIISQIPSLINYIFGALNNLLVGLLFFTPLFFILKFKFWKSKDSFLIILFTLIAGLGSVLLNDGNGDNYQFFSNLLIILSIIISIFFIHSFNEQNLQKSRYYTFILILLFFCLIPIVNFKNKIGQTYKDKSFISKTFNEIKNDRNKNIILIFKSKTEEATDFYSWSVRDNDIYLLKQLRKTPLYFPIANPEIYTIKNKLNKTDIPFYQFWNPINNWKKKGDLKSFIQFYKIKYAIYRDINVLPKFLKISGKIKSKNGLVFCKIKV
jgi:hypothetical protein